MFYNFDSPKMNGKMRLDLFKTILLICNAVGLFIYGFLHFIFFDFPFEPAYEAIVLLKLFGVASCFAAAVCLFILAADTVDSIRHRPGKWKVPAYVRTLSAASLLLVILLMACNGQVAMGVEKDLNTGLVTNYKSLKPERVLLVMNDEVLNHTDIPLGESFMLINDKLKGLVAKDGKVSVGCSLVIADKKGKVLLNEPDLFKGKDVLDKDSVNYLRCTIPTGKPMEWEEQYDAKVRFWDKYGNGEIVNKVSFRCIDIP